MKIPELFKQELLYWTKTNQSFFGVTPIDEKDDFNKIQESLDKDCEAYWNSNKPCKLAKNLNNGLLNRDASKQTPNSYKLKLNFHNMCIDVFGDYSGTLLKIAAIPTPSIDLCWIINRSHYVPRVTAIKDYYEVVGKLDFQTIRGEGWNYDIATDTFTCIMKDENNQFDVSIEEIYNYHLSYRSKCLLTAVLGEPLTIDNFKDGLKQLPKFSDNSIYNYKFSRMEYFEDVILNSQKYAQPTKKILLGVNVLINSKSKQYTTTGEKIEGCLVRSDSTIFALENFRTCVNIYKNPENLEYQPAFNYTDTTGFFDSFKTVTSKSAGRQRLLLDNVVVKNGMLWIVDEDGTQHNMYEFLDMPQNKRLSCLSESPFCNNDKPKRIMMNAKMTAQSVTLKDEMDSLTHRITARVGFTDLEGYTSADSIAISESFAKRLTTYDETILYLDKASNVYKLITKKKVKFDLYTLKQIFPERNDAILLSYQNVHISKIDDVDKKYARVFLAWEIPFRLGDKITNLHGAKGTVGFILPDKDMPKLTKKVGNMKAGPLDIIISGYSTIRRGSLGQIFEAWALASGIDYEGHDYIAEMMEQYGSQMKTYSKNSIVEYKGEKKVIPVGINYIMRLYHHASSHISISSANTAFQKTLKFGEMEKLNLVANDCPNILLELGIRSIKKYIGSHKLVDEMERTRELPERKDLNISLQFIEILKSMGYEMKIDKINKPTYENMDEVDLNNVNSLFNTKGVEEDDNSDTTN